MSFVVGLAVMISIGFELVLLERHAVEQVACFWKNGCMCGLSNFPFRVKWIFKRRSKCGNKPVTWKATSSMKRLLKNPLTFLENFLLKSI